MSDGTAEATGRMLADLDHIKADITDIKRTLENKYVTQDQFDPIKRIVYGLVSIVLTAITVAVVAMVLR